MKQCFHILTNVFGAQEKDLINKFSIMIKSYFSNRNDKEKIQKIKGYDFLYLLCEEYHHNKLENPKQNLIYCGENQINQISFDNFQETGDSSLEKEQEKETFENNYKVSTTTKNLKPEFDNIFNEMKRQSALKDELEIKADLLNSNNKMQKNDTEKRFQVKIFTEYEKQILFTMESNLNELVLFLIFLFILIF